jgi:predicted GNAT superfamily acetyltransferase
MAAMTDDGARADALEVRMLDDLADLESVDVLFASVWGPGTPVIGVELLRAFAHGGGYVSGAYLKGRLVGASVGFRGSHHGRATLHSHATGVSVQARGLHVGRTLKLHQRDWAADSGIPLITWTFDPLVRRNAWFNISRLGARPAEYLVDFYGPMTDAINAGDPSDRLLMVWEVAGQLPHAAIDATTHDVVATPEDIEALRVADPAAASVWRLRLREELREPVEAGRVIGFTRDGGYLLAARP